MLTKRQNLLETIRGGRPDRYVNQFEAFSMIRGTPFSKRNPNPARGEMNVVNAWGITKSFPANVPGPFPVHTPDKIVIQDIEHWRDYVKVPDLIFPEEEWAPYVAAANAVDRNEYFATVGVLPGIFEQCHYLMSVQNCLVNLYDYPDEMHEIIDTLTEFELAYAREVCSHLHPDAILHHDDWGTQISTFMAPAMFREFYVPAYKKVYGYYKEHGVQVIIHHSDSYCATLVDDMIDLGIDIWQGVMRSNDIPELLKKYTGKITFMGGIDNADVDREDWDREMVAAAVRRAVNDGARLSFIPCMTGGGPGSTFPGVYDAVTDEIRRINESAVTE